MGAGIHFWGDVEQQTRLLKLGANMLIHSADISLFQKHLQMELSAIKTAAGLTREDTCKFHSHHWISGARIDRGDSIFSRGNFKSCSVSRQDFLQVRRGRNS